MVSVIQVYAPTEDSRNEMKEEFYEQLQVTVREVHRQDKLVVMGDLNARVGDNVKVWGELLESKGKRWRMEMARGSCSSVLRMTWW